MKRGTIAHPKMVELQALLDVPAYVPVGILESLWHWTARYCPQGDLGRYSNRIIAQAVGWPEGDADRLINALVETGWIDAHDVRRLVVHDWHEHADDSVHAFLARKTMRFATGQLPKTSRLSKDERARIKRAYKESESVRTECAFGHTQMHTESAEKRPANANANANALASCKRSNHKAIGGESERGKAVEAVGDVALRCIADFDPVPDPDQEPEPDDSLGMYRELISQATHGDFRWRGSHLLKLERILSHARGPTLIRERVIDPLENSEAEAIKSPGAFANHAIQALAKELGVAHG